MLLSGFILRIINDTTKLKFVDEMKPLYYNYVANFASALILIRAGLSVDLTALKKLRFFAPIAIGCASAITQTIVVAILVLLIYRCNALLAFIYGSALAAVSIAVITPVLIDLQVQGYGVLKGIPSMVKFLFLYFGKLKQKTKKFFNS